MWLPLSVPEAVSSVHSVTEKLPCASVPSIWSVRVELPVEERLYSPVTELPVSELLKDVVMVSVKVMLPDAGLHGRHHSRRTFRPLTSTRQPHSLQRRTAPGRSQQLRRRVS